MSLVAVVGLGPTGLAMSLLLSSMGVEVVAIDQNIEPPFEPRTAILDDWAARVLLGECPSLEKHESMLKLGVQLVGKAGVPLHPREANYPLFEAFSQPHLESLLRNELAKRHGVRCFFGYKVTHVEEGARGCRVTASSNSSTKAHIFDVTFVVGCDGASSIIRRYARLNMPGSTLSSWLVVDAAPPLRARGRRRRRSEDSGERSEGSEDSGGRRKGGSRRFSVSSMSEWSHTSVSLSSVSDVRRYRRRSASVSSFRSERSLSSESTRSGLSERSLSGIRTRSQSVSRGSVSVSRDSGRSMSRSSMRSVSRSLSPSRASSGINRSRSLDTDRAARSSAWSRNEESTRRKLSLSPPTSPTKPSRSSVMSPSRSPDLLEPPHSPAEPLSDSESSQEAEPNKAIPQGRHVAPMSSLRVICDPARPGLDLPLPNGHMRFEWLLKDREIIPPDEVLRAWIVQRGIEPGLAGGLRFIRKARYVFHARTASPRWCSKSRRLIVAGDAAHLSPPFPGQGVSLGIADASNLSWKICCVLRGVAPLSLIDSFEQERRPHVQANTSVAVWLGRVLGSRSRVFCGLRDSLLPLASPLFRSAFSLSPKLHTQLQFPRSKSSRLLGSLFPLEAPSFCFVARRREFLPSPEQLNHPVWKALRGRTLVDGRLPVRLLLVRPDCRVLAVAEAGSALPLLLDALAKPRVRAGLAGTLRAAALWVLYVPPPLLLVLVMFLPFLCFLLLSSYFEELVS